MNKCPFWYERGRIGGVIRLLSCVGGFFRFRCMTPPSPPLFVVWACGLTSVFLGIAWVSDWNRISLERFSGSFRYLAGFSYMDGYPLPPFDI